MNVPVYSLKLTFCFNTPGTWQIQIYVFLISFSHLCIYFNIWNKKYFDNKNLLLLLQHCHNFERNEFLIPCWTVRTAAHGFSFEILIVDIIEKKIIITNIDKSTVHPQIVQEENRISFWKHSERIHGIFWVSLFERKH